MTTQESCYKREFNYDVLLYVLCSLIICLRNRLVIQAAQMSLVRVLHFSGF